MTTLAVDTTQTRRFHQQHVAALLEQLDARRRQLYLLEASGARPAGLTNVKADLRALRNEIATTVAATKRAA